MKLQWMKEIMGDAYTEDLDAKVCQAVGERFIARTDFNDKNAKVKELETQVTQLADTVKTRDTQLEELKKSVGDNAELQKQMEALTQKNKEDKAAYDKELAQVKLLAAVDAELTAAGSRNNTAVKAVLADFLAGAKVEDGKIVASANGENITLAARIEAMKKDTTTDFMFGTKYDGWKPGEGGDGKKPGAEKKTADMSYSELAAYLAGNPDAKLED